MKTIRAYYIRILMAALLLVTGQAAVQAQTSPPNIIFLIIDDLNDYTTALKGHPQTFTPNIERLEDWGTTFTNAHTSSPKCAPSRTSFITGKDLAYTQVYNNLACKPFREYFSDDDDNEEVFTMPEYFKDHGGYFTYGINKINHCFDTYFDYDSLTEDPCLKQLSWSKYSLFIAGEDSLVRTYGNDNNDGTAGLAWTPIPDSMETHMYDHRAVDTAAQFFRAYSDGTLDACGKPFFMYVGFRKPHEPFFIPEKYFNPEYCYDLYQDPLDLPFNEPENVYPFNGFVMPPQPDTIYEDFFHLPEGGLGQYMAAFDSVYFDILEEIEDMDTLPNVADGLTEEQQIEILHRVHSANVAMAYVAAVRYLDAQIGRLLDSLAAYPELMNNTILVLASDHGFSLGEKRHWEKGALWETDQRVPLIISDMRAPLEQQVSAPVSLLDIFPTLCTMADIPMPEFTDGTPYLDGQDLSPLLAEPSRNMERPALSAYRERNTAQLSCRPQYSLRTDRFHYILYTSNGPEGSLDCDPLNYYHEEELYEIGVARETDPNEWNNLAYDPDYAPVIEYLQQWLPDSALYLQKNFTARVRPVTTECLLDTSDVIDLSFDMYAEDGVDITPPDSFIYVWSNNLSDTLLYGTTAEFPLHALPDSMYATHDRMIWYLHAYNAGGVARAFDMRYVFLDPASAPHVSFDLVRIDSLTVAVTDIAFSGTYTNVVWDFGDGVLLDADIPGPHTYADDGAYPVTCNLYYGNAATCVDTETRVLSILDDEDLMAGALTVYPNPSDGTIHVAAEEPFNWGSFRLYDMSGRLVFEENVPAGPIYDYSLHLSGLARGVYALQYVSFGTALTARVIIFGS